MSDEAKKTDDKAEVIANPASDVSELNEESLKNVSGGAEPVPKESISFNFTKVETS